MRDPKPTGKATRVIENSDFTRAPSAASLPTFGEGPAQQDTASTRVLVVHPHLKGNATSVSGQAIPVRPQGKAPVRGAEARLGEAVALAAAIALEVAEALIVPLAAARPGTYIGSGKVEEIGERIKELGAALVIMDCELSPGQQRNLERAWDTKVIDRTGLILEIFGARAQTREGRLQVELAHLTYQKSRLVRSWTHLERQRGGVGFLGGPGETQIEVDRRMLEERISRIRKSLEGVVRTRTLHRKSRKRLPYPVIALVGYTNAGKSTLFNRLTEADVVAEDMLFATLDPTMRRVKLPSGRVVILSDTVGFVSSLPTHLVAAFRATLEEVTEADIIIHVRDIAHGESEAQRDDVLGILDDLNNGDGAPVIEALNKLDLVDPDSARELLGRSDNHDLKVPISALDGTGIQRLLQTVDEVLSARAQSRDLVLRPEDGAALAWLYAHGRVVTREDRADGIRVRVKLDPSEWGRFSKAYPDGIGV